MADKLEEYSDSELFHLMQSDKKTAERAFSELYNRLSPKIYAYCRRFLGNREEAEDMFQETFVKFYQSSKFEKEMTNVPAYLLRIARNLCMNQKERHAEKLVSFEDYMAVNEEGDNREEKNELLDLVKRALELLSDEYREIFILREYEGLPYNEIAKVLDITMEAVKVRLFRAKKRVREVLAPYLTDMTKFN